MWQIPAFPVLGRAWADIRAGQHLLQGFCPTALLYPSHFSPMMNRFFPANFPNKQYQLLFTEGSGESKEGTLARPARWGPACFLPLLFWFCSLGGLTFGPFRQPS